MAVSRTMARSRNACGGGNDRSSDRSASMLRGGSLTSVRPPSDVPWALWADRQRTPRAAGHLPGMRDQADEDHGHGCCEGDGVDRLTRDDDPVSSTATTVPPG